ncbi:MAG: hypothetical protein WD708_05860 [Kiritimatiellia bacterium]
MKTLSLHQKFSRISLTALLAVGSAQAATVGYWRMENNFLNESGTLAGSGGDLTASGAVTTETHAVAGTTDFYDPVPATGASNSYTGSGFGSGKMLLAPDSAAFDLSVNNAFTAEALIRPTSMSQNGIITGQWLASTGNRSWFLVLNNTGQLRLTVSQDGTSIHETYLSTTGGLGTIATNKDYYVAGSPE